MFTYNCSVQLNGTDAALSLFERVAYTSVFTVGLILNMTALCILCRTKHWTDTHIYMLNLMIADCLAILFLPFRVFESFCRLDATTFCTFLLCSHYCNMYCSILTITAISMHRFVAVRFPFVIKALISKRKMIAISVCILIWAIIVVICAIFYRDLLPSHLETCYDLKIRDKLTLTFFLLLEVVGYLIPIVIIVFCSTQIIYILVKSLQHVEGSSRMERRNIAAVIAANMFTFIVCFTPFHIGLLIKYKWQDSSSNFVHAFLDVSEWVATTNCCLDSIGYYFLLKRVSREHNSY